MATNLYNISQVLGISIVHSLWQGMLIYIVLRCIFYAAPSLSSLKKHYVGVLAMLAVFVLFAFTLAYEVSAIRWGAKAVLLGQLLPGIHFIATPASPAGFLTWLAPYMPYICTLYTAGLLFNLVKLGWDWRKIRFIKQSALGAEQMQQYISKFAGKLGIAKRIGIKFSEAIDVPCVIGYLKPLILLPVSLSTQLTACEVESILLHELAHIKRNDYLVNLLQQAISAMLFFNPFSRLINRAINQERENSCDDLVIAKTGKPLIYARALLKLETGRTENLQLALAATGKKFYLFKRIERIMKTQQQKGHMRHFMITLLLLAGGICCVAWFNPVYAKIKGNLSRNTINKSIDKPSAGVDTTNYSDLADTGKHKTKTIVKKHTAVKKAPKVYEYDGDDDSTAAYFRSPEWKAQQEQWKKMGEDFKKQFDSPEWKKQMEVMKNQALAMQKQFDGPEWKAQQEQFKKMGEEMKKQFDSPEWKAQQETWKKQAEDLKKQFDSPEWKAQQEEWKKMGEDFKKQFNSPEWKAQQEQWRKQFDNPEWKEHWKKQAEEWKKQFNSPEWKARQEEWKKMGEQIQKEFGKEWKDSLKNQNFRDTTVGGIHIYRQAPKDSLR